MFSRFISTLAFLILHGVVCKETCCTQSVFRSVFPVHGSRRTGSTNGAKCPNSHSFQSPTHRSGNEPEPRDLACASFVDSFSNFKQKKSLISGFPLCLLHFHSPHCSKNAQSNVLLKAEFSKTYGETLPKPMFD